MKTLLSYACVLLLFVSCGTSRHLSVNDNSDSTRVEVREVYIDRIDTVYVEIPKIVEKVTTKDTVSHLENDFALSEAEIKPDGYLYHTLETKAEKRPIQVITKEIVRDSIVYRDREVYIETPVEVEKPKTWFEKLQSAVFGIIVVGIAIWVGVKMKDII